MAIIDQISNVLGFGGKTQSKVAGADKTSAIHNTSSINNKPEIKQAPSQLDLDGKTPSKYIDTYSK